MEFITLNNNVKMPLLGYGVYQVTQEECEKCVLDALSVGYHSLKTTVMKQRKNSRILQKK